MKFLDFREVDGIGRKTKVWIVVNKKHNDPLGYIEWYNPWRRYTFFPREGTLFDKNCLDEISRFMSLEYLSPVKEKE